MRRRALLSSLFVFLPLFAIAQGTPKIGGTPSTAPRSNPSDYEAILGSMVAPGTTPPGQVNYDLWFVGEGKNGSPLQGASGSVSALDFKAPQSARREYAKGFQFLTKKEFRKAIQHLTAAVSIDEQFVSAQNALGSAYFQSGQNELARDHFAKAVSLDDHLPSSFMNLGCAQMALKQYPEAEESVKKAASMAPLDLQLATALAYAEVMNKDYPAVLATAREVHGRKHNGAAVVHYFAAAAWESQKNLQETENELQTLLAEAPNSPAGDQARKALVEIKAQAARQAESKQKAAVAAYEEATRERERASLRDAEQKQLNSQDSKEETQVVEAASAPDTGAPACTSCAPTETQGSTSLNSAAPPSAAKISGEVAPFSFRAGVDEVAVFFSATDHGRSVTDLTREEVGILDNQKPPATITGFRNEAQLPLRLGIIIDTSESVLGRFSFEQRAASHFMEKTLTHAEDLAFVVGVANSVLLAQDFTNDQARISHGISQLAPAGGTALWDAVAFAARKLADRPETQPVARLLVVISDGKDNSSNISLKEAIAAAESGEVAVYTVSATELSEQDDQPTMGSPTVVGDRALKLLAERTGGAPFTPKSLHGLDHGLEQVQEVIHSRYLVSYKPALFKHDGQFRAIDIQAEKSGRKLRVYARRGYYAKAETSSAASY